MNVVRNISDIVFKIEKVLIIILIPVMLTSMVVDIFFRYVVSTPVVWAQELSLYVFIWSSFVGASMSIKSREAVSVSIITDRLSKQLRRKVILLGLFISSLFVIYLLYLSVSWISSPNILFQTSVTTQTPMVYMYMCIPISLLFMTVHFISWFFETLTEIRKG